MNRFRQALLKKNHQTPPVWFMRQAGRYHAHYQALRQKYSFIELCKNPEIACEAAMGPLRDFDFDAAILFSDLLFPLEAMGMGLNYENGPQLNWYLQNPNDVQKLQSGADLARKHMEFQAQAIRLMKQEVPSEKGILGFVGGPLTLFCYAVEGSHQGGLHSARQGIQDGRFVGFCKKLLDFLVENMVMQADAGIDALAVLDTCAGDFDPQTYQTTLVPVLKEVLEQFKRRCPNTPIVYYSKNTGPLHWQSLKTLPIEGLGIDWKHSLADVLLNWTEHWTIQGNIDPHWLFLEPKELLNRLTHIFQTIKDLPLSVRQAWICGLGHGVLPQTPEENVRRFIQLQREIFSGN